MHLNRPPPRPPPPVVLTPFITKKARWITKAIVSSTWKACFKMKLKRLPWTVVETHL